MPHDDRKPSVPNSTWSCPTPQDEGECITLGHGGGGRLSHRLIEDLIVGELGSHGPQTLLDSAVLRLNSKQGRLAFTTDSFVVSPWQFPGGNIGHLAVFGTVNDLAMVGAQPRWLSCSLIIEEGLPIAQLRQIMQTLRIAAERAEVDIVTGDTKVVERGHGDGVYINTAGIGLVEHDLDLDLSSVQPDDVVCISGPLGLHGAAVMAERHGFAMSGDLLSDCAPLHKVVQDLIAAGIPLRTLRDITRGGLASVLNEWVAGQDWGVVLEEEKVPRNRQVQSVCEVLGLEDVYLACEGRFACIVPSDAVQRTLEVLSRWSVSQGAAAVGRIRASNPGDARMQTRWGTQRILPMLSGEQLPRIC